MGRKRFVYLVFTVGQRLWRYALSSSNHMKWIMKAKPTSRWSLQKINVLCTETEWHGMLISNRYKVSFVVQCRYTNKHGKHCKEISKFNNYKYQDEKQFFPWKEWTQKLNAPIYANINFDYVFKAASGSNNSIFKRNSKPQAFSTLCCK